MYFRNLDLKEERKMPTLRMLTALNILAWRTLDTKKMTQTVVILVLWALPETSYLLSDTPDLSQPELAYFHPTQCHLKDQSKIFISFVNSYFALQSWAKFSLYVFFSFVSNFLCFQSPEQCNCT